MAIQHMDITGVYYTVGLQLDLSRDWSNTILDVYTRKIQG